MRPTWKTLILKMKGFLLMGNFDGHFLDAGCFYSKWSSPNNRIDFFDEFRNKKKFESYKFLQHLKFKSQETLDQTYHVFNSFFFIKSNLFESFLLSFKVYSFTNPIQFRLKSFGGSEKVSSQPLFL